MLSAEVLGRLGAQLITWGQQLVRHQQEAAAQELERQAGEWKGQEALLQAHLDHLRRADPPR